MPRTTSVMDEGDQKAQSSRRSGICSARIGATRPPMAAAAPATKMQKTTRLDEIVDPDAQPRQDAGHDGGQERLLRGSDEARTSVATIAIV